MAVSGINILQFHGEETPEFCAQFGLPLLKAFRIKNRDSLDECTKFRDCAWLLDSHVEGAQGGTGVAFNWEVATEAVRLNPRTILAGGLKVENVADAVRQVRPFGVDVSSGVEAGPGRKDHEKIRRFIAAARGAAD
jgi:phosphoribosylanthranilate isomerase